MKRFLTILTAITLTTSICSAADKYVVVRTTGLDKSETYSVKTEKEFREYSKAISKEKMLFSKAMMKASKDWRKQEDSNGKSFPRGCVTARATKKMGTAYKDQSKAQEKCNWYVTEKPKKDKERAEKRKKNKAEAMKNMDSGQDQKKSSRADEVKKLKEQAALDKEKYEETARAYFKGILDELKNPTPATP